VKITDVSVVGVQTDSAPATRLQEGWLFVRVHTDAGLIGLGEASQGGNAVVRAFLEGTLRDLLIGRDPCQIEPLASEILSRANGRGPATAVSGVEQALWDIWGQSLGQPIWALLGGRHRDRIVLYANVNRATFDRSPAGFAQIARGAVGDGFRAVKCAPFDDVTFRYPDSSSNLRGIKVGIERVAAMREEIGPDVRLMVDCHARFDVPTAIQVARELAPLNLTWLEEPVPESDLDGLERIREQSEMPIAGAEGLIGRHGYWETIRRRALDVIMPDVKHTGGILELRKIAAMAETVRLTVSPHNPSGPISTMASVHACAAIPNFLALEYPWGEATWRRDLLAPAEILEDGSIAVPERPGLGFTLNEDILASHRSAS
jgi:galactonate dehydratase